MNNDLLQKMLPNHSTKYLFFGGKGGVGKTTMATATAVWFADHGYRTTIVSTDPTVSLSTVFNQHIGGDNTVKIKEVKNLCGLNINPTDSKGVFLTRLTGVMSQISGTFGNDVVSTPCMEEMATFDQFVTFLDQPDGDVVVFDTAPTGKSLRELAMPFDWASFLQNQIVEGKKLAELLNTGDDGSSMEDLERDKKRYDTALNVLRDKAATVFNLVLLPERLPIEETQSAITGLSKLNIPVQGIVVNQTILPEVIEGNRFLQARASLQKKYLDEIDTRFNKLLQIKFPLLDQDISNIASLRKVGKLLYGDGQYNHEG